MENANEDSQVELLTSMMGDIDPEMARRVLRHHKGSIENAAASLLDGNTDFATTSTSTQYEPPKSPPPSKPVIDLTGDDDDPEMSKALRASLEDSGIGQHQTSSRQSPAPQFRPSDRAPDPNWAMVSTQTPTGVSQEEQSLNQAIQESLSVTWDRDMTTKEKTLEEMIRRDGRPTALRSQESSLMYTAPVIQSLFCIPQVRQAVAAWSVLIGDDNQRLFNDPEYSAYKLAELFVNMDLAALSELKIDDFLRELAVSPPLSAIPQPPGEASVELFRRICNRLEGAIYKSDTADEPQWPRIFTFRHGHASTTFSDKARDPKFDECLVRVNIPNNDEHNNLIDCLSDILTKDSIIDPEVIFEPSDAIVFHLIRQDTLPSYSGSISTTRRPFRYPKHLYLDQFLKENYEITTASRVEKRKKSENIRQLNLRRTSLTHFKGKDVLENLRSSVYYYEHVAERSSPERKAAVENLAERLRTILSRLEGQVKEIETEISKLEELPPEPVENPELMKHRYDLRAVLVHDGQFGRSHIYSYTFDKGKWWLTADQEVTEVHEDQALNDVSGLHFGAGPYMLLYSRALPDELMDKPLEWPDCLRLPVIHNNNMLYQDAGSGLESPFVDYATPSSVVANASPQELMDTNE